LSAFGQEAQWPLHRGFPGGVFGSGMIRNGMMVGVLVSLQLMVFAL
jgi:hypothetical protein